MNRSDLFVPSHVNNEYRCGRNLHEGYSRGLSLWGGEHKLQFINDDPAFREALQYAAGRSVVGMHNLANFFLLVTFFLPALLEGRPASIVEFGVAKGGSLLFLASLARRFLPYAQVLGFDTFEGMPAVDTEADWHLAGDFADVDFDEIECIGQSLGNVRLFKGRFAETAYVLDGGGRYVALCHIDCDVRDSVAFAFEAVRPHMLPGGYYIFDDALHPSCMGAMEAIEEHVIRGAGLSCEQNYPHLVFREPMRGPTQG